MMTEDTIKTKQVQKSPNLNSVDVVAILTCWSGAAAVAYVSENSVVAVIAIAAAYYLAKWIILKSEIV